MAIGLGLSFLMTLILPGDIGKMKSKTSLKTYSLNLKGSKSYFLHVFLSLEQEMYGLS